MLWILPRASRPSPLLELVLFASEELGVTGDRELASLFGVSPETIGNWRSGSVKDVKGQTLEAVKRGLHTRLAMLQERAGAAADAFELGLCPMEVEEGSDPASLQRQLRDRVIYDYLGHRFLYYDPQGALAWEMLIKEGYDQDRWLRGVGDAADEWLDTKRDRHGRPKGPLARTLHLERSDKRRGLDVISLGPGEGGKETLVLEKLLERSTDGSRYPWLGVCLVDVSIPLLLKAAQSAHRVLKRSPQDALLLPICGDFEEGPLRFPNRLPTGRAGEDGLRLVVMLGNTFGNLRNEESFVRKRLWKLTRPGDYLWIEVGLKLPRADEPLYRLTEDDRAVTAAETNRRRLLTGPYRRWEAAAGRTPPANLDMRVWVREDDETTPVPGSLNFCHDLVLLDERRACTMLYSRRYDLEGLSRWFEDLEYEVVRLRKVEDSKRRARVAHLLLRRK